MSSRWVVNASPSILLGKVDRLPLLRALATELVVPEGVAREARAGPDGERLLDSLIPAARPILDQLRGVGMYVSDDLVERGLAHLGEAPDVG